MHSDSWPRTRRAKYLLLLLGLAPFGEIAYIAGPKALLPIAVGVMGAVAVGLRILLTGQRIRALDQSNARREASDSTGAGSTSFGRRDDGDA
jgi:hypothetical protein